MQECISYPGTSVSISVTWRGCSDHNVDTRMASDNAHRHPKFLLDSMFLLFYSKYSVSCLR